MDAVGDFDTAWQNLGEGDTLLESNMMDIMGDGNYSFQSSQELNLDLVRYINDTQSNPEFNLEQEGCEEKQQTESNETSDNPAQAIINFGDNSLPRFENIPANTNWPGKYNFNIMFDPQVEKTTKSTTWTYSESLDKLFVMTLKAVDIRFVLGAAPPPGCIIRALPIFTKPEHSLEIVRRCPNHCLPSDSTNEGHPAPEHIVRCENKNALYEESPLDGRLSVIVPYESPQVGTHYSSYLYKFMCYSSCVGGLNRRPIRLQFTLEKNGEILGRRNLKVRICACPGRDRKTEERRKHSARSLSRQSSFTKGVAPDDNCPVPMKRMKRDNDVYTITVRGRENYEMLSRIAEGLELRMEASADRLDALRAERSSRLLSEPLVRSASIKGSSGLLLQPKIEKE